MLMLPLYIIPALRTADGVGGGETVSGVRVLTAGGRVADAMRRVIRLFFILAFLSGILGSGISVRAQGFLATEQKSEEQVKQNDGYLKPVAEEPQSPVEVVFRSAPSPHRIASNRPTRLLPTHGGKPTNHGGRWAKGESYNPLISPSLRSCRRLFCHRTTAASPRLRYVIALRRLLC